MTIKKPIKRSALRLSLGKKYYTSKRYLYWFFKHKTFANAVEAPLEHTIMTHQTPLRRVLKNVDQVLNDRKIINLQLAMNQINGLIIEPGQIFSYWKRIGKPTYNKGFVDGMVLQNGSFKEGVGGGLCQLSNMIYWMTIHTPLTVLERHRHSYDVFPDHKRTQPFASGATCVYNYRDLQIKNETHETYQLVFHMDDNFLYGKILSDKKAYFEYQVYEKHHEIRPTYFGGYSRHNQINRRVYDMNKQVIADEVVCENHAFMMYSPLLNPPMEFTEESS